MVAEEVGGGRWAPLEEALWRGHGQDEALLVEGLQSGQGGQAPKAWESPKGQEAVAVGAQITCHVLIVAVVLERKNNKNNVLK